jgi:hypothetical protein
LTRCAEGRAGRLAPPGGHLAPARPLVVPGSRVYGG